MSAPLQPCGTPAAWRRHRRRGEAACEPCQVSFRAYATAKDRARGIGPRKYGVPDTETLIEELEHLTRSAQGTDYILKAVGYTGREKQLKDRLQKHGRADLYHRAISEEYWLAA